MVDYISFAKAKPIMPQLFLLSAHLMCNPQSASVLFSLSRPCKFRMMLVASSATINHIIGSPQSPYSTYSKPRLYNAYNSHHTYHIHNAHNAYQYYTHHTYHNHQIRHIYNALICLPILNLQSRINNKKNIFQTITQLLQIAINIMQ